MADDTRDVEEHLRAASDAILLLLGEVGQLESHKRGVRPGEPRFDELARSVRRAAQALADFTAQEEAWARASSDVPGLATIADSESPPRLSEILERWRAIERRLDQAEPGSEESARLFDEFQHVRDEYMAAFRARRQNT